MRHAFRNGLQPGPRAAVALLLTILSAPSLARAVCPVRTSWPDPNWSSRAAAAQRVAERAALEALAFTDQGEEADADRVRTHSLFVVQAGEVVYSREAHGFNPGQRHPMREASGAWLSALAGTAVAHGALQLDASICDSFPDLTGQRCAILASHLLDASSGLRWLDGADTPELQQQSQPAMLFGEGRHDAASFVLAQPLRDLPGTTWHASSGDTTVLATVVDRAMQPRAGADWPWQELFDATGMHAVVVERDASDNLLAGTQVWASATDQARLGLLFLDDGCWQGNRLLPEGWVQSATTVPSVFATHRRATAMRGVPGRLWWVNRAVPEQQLDRPWPRLPEDSFAALGSGGQMLVVVPSWDLIVARTGRDGAQGSLDLETLVLLAMALAEP